MASYILEKERLTDEYREAFEKIETYSMLHGFDLDTDNEMMLNMLDILYTAQVNNKPVENIIGRNIEQFCRDYFSDCNENKAILKRLPQFLYSLSGIILILSILEIIFPEDENIPVTKAVVNVNGLVAGIICGIVVSLVIGYIGEKILFKLRKVRANLIAVIIFITFAAACIATVVITVDETVNIKLLPAVLISGIYVVAYKLCRIFSRYKKYGNMKKPVKENSLMQIWNEAFTEGMEEQREKIAIKLKKQYEKKNVKLKKKGKPEFTPQEYSEWLHRRNVTNRKIYKYVLSIFYILLYIVFLTGVFLSDASIKELVIHAAVMFVCLLILYIFLMKFVKLYDMNEMFLNKCEEEGITIIELAQQAESKKEKL